MSDSGREWRKVYRSITSSDRLASVSDGAAWLYTLLLVSQDDEGRYPWTKAMVRTLTATRPDWSFDDTSTLLHELVDVELASIEDGLVELRRGTELNGLPRSAHERRQYQAPAVLRQGVTQGAAKVPLDIKQGSHGLEKEKRESSPPAGAHRARTKGSQQAWESPDWFIPLTTLEGYRRGNHAAAAQRILQTCDAAGVDARAVVAGFAERFPIIKFSYGWTNPVATLKGTPLAIAIREVKASPPARNGGPSKHAAGAQASDERFARETSDG